MKRKLFLMSLMLMSILGVNAQKSWIFSDEAFLGGEASVEFTEATTIDGLTIAPAPAGTDAGKGVMIDANSKTVDGVKYTHRLKLGGTATATERNLSFQVDGFSKITIVLMSASGDNDRTLNICKNSYDKNNPIGTMPALGKSAEKVSFNYVGEAATIFLGSHSSGINIYAIYVEPLTVYSIVGDFSGGWDNDLDMVQSEENENIYTLTVENFVVDKDMYEYKLRSNHSWDGYQLPANDKNNDWKFDNPDYPHGIYNLTFTADVANNTLTVDPQKAPMPSTVDITVGDEVTDGTVFYTTYSSIYPLDFTGVEGIKAYTAKKNITFDYNTYTTITEAILTPVEKVPANTGVLIKANEAKTYTVNVPEEEVAALEDNDLLVAAEKTDLFPMVDGYNYSVLTLQRKLVSYFDYSTFQRVEEMATGFMQVDVPAEAEVSFLEKGDVYLEVDKDELNDLYDGYLKLVFMDAELPVAESIAALIAMEEGDNILRFAENTLVTFADDEHIAIEDNTGGMILENPGLTVSAGDVLSGELTGSFNKSILYPIMQKSTRTDASTVTVASHQDVTPMAAASFEEAFDESRILRLVKLNNITAKVEVGSYGTRDIIFIDDNGSEVPAFTSLFVASYGDLDMLNDGDVIKNLEGYAFIVPEESMYASYFEPYEFVPIKAEKLHTYSIVGDFFTTDEIDGWENDQPMTQSEENENIYTLVVENFAAEAKTYEYKLRADGEWKIYDLPIEGNQNFIFGTEGYPAGNYNLTFTADVANHTLTLDVAPVAEEDPNLLPNIAAMKAYEGEGGNMKLKLTNAKVTYAGTFSEDYGDGYSYESDYCVLEDETGAYMFNTIGLGKAFATGNILNGVLELTILGGWGLDVMANENTEASFAAIEVTEGTIEPMVVNEENFEAYAENFDWKYVKFENVSGTKNEYDEFYLDIPLFGNTYGCMDTFGVITEWPADGEEVDAVGFLYDFFGYSQYFQPIAFIKHEAETHTYAIVGDLTGGWEADAVMTQSEEDENVYTLTVEGFEAFAKSYEYKLRADNAWGIYELPAEGNNSYTFEEKGVYTLTFTANIAEGTLTMTAEKTGDFDVTYSVVGDFFGEDGWNNDQDMTQSTEDENVYTLVIEQFEAEAKTYEYKLRANHAWGLYELPASGNQNFEFGTEGYPAGVYTLTFTANVAENVLTLDVKKFIPTGINGVNVDWNDGNTYNLNGQRISRLTKGVVIRDGKKIVVK